MALLEGQVLVDVGIEFPGCQVTRARSGGGWYAIYRDPAEGRGTVAWLVHEPVIADLPATLRALAHQMAYLRRRP